jgi:FkbM family methyltransferase
MLIKIFAAIRNPKSSVLKLIWRVKRFFNLHILKDPYAVEVTRWRTDQGDALLRFDYPSLNEGSVVFDLGGYIGDFAFKINQKFGCKVYLFEPHPQFYQRCMERFRGNNQIIPLNYAVSDSNGIFELSDTTDGSSFVNPSQDAKRTLKCETRDLLQIIRDLKVQHIDLMKINIEGGEYQVLNYMIEKDLTDLVDVYQIQFHNFIEDSEAMRTSILSALKKTHEQTWCYKFVWENWKKK